MIIHLKNKCAYMLYYTEFGLSEREVPGERSICIYLSGCCHNCVNCHYPLLKEKDYGDSLIKYYEDIVALYRKQATCVCLLGEGANTEVEHNEMRIVVEYAKQQGLKTCLYSGRDIEIEAWMTMFDYIKLGSYQEDKGGLESLRTNQVMWKKNSQGAYENITALFCVDVISWRNGQISRD